jgi:hypothetical protein
MTLDLFPTKITYTKAGDCLLSKYFSANGNLYYVCINLSNRTYSVRETLNDDQFTTVHKTSYKSLRKAKEEVREYLESLGVKFKGNFKQTIP